MSRVVVTGGAGMIGTNLVVRLISMGKKVLVVDDLSRGSIDWLNSMCQEAGQSLPEFNKTDLAVPGSFARLIQKGDTVIHLADVVGGIGYVFSHQGDVFSRNLLINTYVVQACREVGVAEYLYVGTACSFPAFKQNSLSATPLVEDDQYPAMPESAYGWSKLMGEYEAFLMEKEVGIPTSVLSLHNVYGPPCVFTEPTAQVIPALIRKALQWPEEEFLVWGSGEQGRAFVFVADVVDAICLSLEKGMGKGLIQIGPSTCTSIKEISLKIVEIVGKNIPIRFDTTKPTGDIGRCANFTKAQHILGWEPKYSIEEGLNITINWVRKNMMVNRGQIDK